MNTLIHADIFFFVATIAVIVFLLLGIIVSVYLIGILKNVKKATEKINNTIDDAEEEIDIIKHKIAESSLFNFVFSKKRKPRNK